MYSTGMGQMNRTGFFRQTALIFPLVLLISSLLGSCSSLQLETRGWDALAEFVKDTPSSDLYYEVQGQGTPVLMLHGFGASSYTWRYLAPELASDSRVFLVDLKGFGRSPKPADGRYTLYDQVALIYRFVLEHDLKGLTIVGHSYGGGVALGTALYLSEFAPERLSRLILIDSAGFDQPLPFFMRLLRTPVVNRLGLYLLPAKTQVRHILNTAYHDTDRISEEAVYEYAQALKMPGGRRAILETAGQLATFNTEVLKSRYSRIDVPTLILWGQNDAIIPLAIGRQLNEAIPHSTLYVLGDCGHIPHEEKPAETIKQVREFMNQHF